MLDISPVLLLSSGIIFLLVVARLNSCLFKPLLKHMDDRSESIKRDLDNAKSNSANVDGMLAEANDVIAAAKKEAAAIRDKAYNEAKQSADVKLANAKANLEVKTEEFANTLQEETKALKDSLVASMPQFNESLKAKLSSI
ncbi:F0F1 ATP synthase subunit B' [Malaciobacter molluscorum LMG 25693]|uniref:ATP synthase, F0 complex, b' subunit n=1 Tax=Malaciobacter molluscorum LMG 25693 TaxID=870501 RepID=A0A2G1DHP6_9BACT|nr:F0F1 ATP synthase subunit B' [Malaciobacter molluscorum]AXX92975.1 ATP synthase, F0 complex, b' subunit [Malaciobacter molluscorum LMG 25693]PHO18032.1 F0F1 ATP synthase subunit B' [Malaciobacter molluscorum LMG 25693]